MATRTTLLKLKQNLNLPLRFLRRPAPVLTRPIARFARPESHSLPLFTPSKLARQMATARSPRGASRRNEEDDNEDVEEEFDFDDDDVDMDMDGSEFDDSDDSDTVDFEDEEDEKPKGKKGYSKDW